MKKLIFITLALFSSSLLAYETDQHSNRLEPIKDATAVLNAKVNADIQRIIDTWRYHEQDDLVVIMKVYQALGEWHWGDEIERWAMKTPYIERLSTPRYGSIYHKDIPLRVSRIAGLFGAGSTMKINNQLVGSDKFGHFVSQGYKFYRRYLRNQSEEMSAKQSAKAERAFFGWVTTGAYSNADLVANYEGYLFFRSLFEDDVIPGKKAILRWEGTDVVMQRPFDWADHVNEYWDEALNPNHYDKWLFPYIKERLEDLCPVYWENKKSFLIQNEAPLKARYHHLLLEDTSNMRMDALCGDEKGGDEKNDEGPTDTI